LAIRILEVPYRAPVSGPTFIRLLARLTTAEVPPPHASLSDRLSQWIDWTRAVALSRALDGTPPMEAGAATFDRAEDEACMRTRATLTRAVIDGLPAVASIPLAAEPEYTAFRQHHVAMQRAMLVATGQLRGRLRDLLAATSQELARLAAVDASMEVVLSPREHALLATVPALLEAHFERLRQGARAEAPPSMAPNAWLEVFRRDMQGVLLAELDVRFLPLESLLAALRTHSQGRHVQTAA
jgi:hypothetical protein